MNYFALPSLGLSLVCAFIGQYVYSLNRKHPLNRTFLAFCLLLAYSTFAEFLYRQSLNWESAVFWIRMNSLWPFVFPVMLHFILILTEKIGRKFRWLTLASLYIPATGLSLLFFLKSRTETDMVLRPWGWSYAPGVNPVITWLVLSWILAISVTSLVIAIGHFLTVRDRIKKKQIQIVLSGIGIAVVTGAVIRGLAFVFHLTTPEVDTYFVLPIFGFFGYAIVRYKLFTLTVETSSESILRTLADALFLVNNDGVIIRSNPAAEKLLGIRESRLAGQKVREIFGDIHLSKRIRTRELLKDGVLKYIETYFRDGKGDFVPVGLSASIVRDDFGREQGMVYVFRDLTERRKIEEELWKYRNRLEKMVEERTLELTKVNLKLQDEISHGKVLEQNLQESEQKYRDLIEHQEDIVCRFTPGFEVTFANRAAQKILKMDEDELIGKKWILLVPKSQRRQAEEDFEDLVKKPEPTAYQMQIMASDGTVHWFDWRITPVRDEKGRLVEFQTTGRDITERKEIEDNYHRIQDRIRAIYEAADRIAFIVTDMTLPQPKIMEFSPGAEKIFGYDREEVIGQPVSILGRPEDVRKIPDRYKSIQHTRKAVTGMIRMVRNNNGTFAAYVSNYPLVDPQGDLYGVLIAALDFTEIETVQNRLKEKEWQQKAILDNIPDIAWLKDRDSVFLAVNEAFGREFRQDPSRIVGKTDFDIVPKADADHYRQDDQEVVRTGKRKAIEEELEYPGGRRVVIETMKTPVRNDEGRIIGTAGIARDITKRKEMESAVEKSLHEKETLLQEIHHRLKNNLQVISGMLYLESRKVKDQKVEEIIRNSITRLDTMALIHSQLYEFNRFGEVDMDTFLGKLMPYILQIHQKEGREIRVRYEPGGVRLSLNQAMPLGLMVNEMVTNSLIHAFPDRPSGNISLSLSERNYHVHLVYEDNGPGLAQKTDIEQAQTMGFQLISSLAQQLSGILRQTSTRQGLRYDLEFDNLRVTSPRD